jgi:hypothetical protein
LGNIYTKKLKNINMNMIPCIKCGKDMPELRKTQYGYNFCVNCSTVGAKKAIPVQMGTGDHTWEETIIMDEETYKKVISTEERLLNNKL